MPDSKSDTPMPTETTDLEGYSRGELLRRAAVFRELANDVTKPAWDRRSLERYATKYEDATRAAAN